MDSASKGCYLVHPPSTRSLNASRPRPRGQEKVSTADSLIRAICRLRPSPPGQGHHSPLRSGACPGGTNRWVHPPVSPCPRTSQLKLVLPCGPGIRPLVYTSESLNLGLSSKVGVWLGPTRPSRHFLL